MSTSYNGNGAVSKSSYDRRHKYSFERPWFERTIREWETVALPLGSKKLAILEIGSFEGASTTWILDNLLHHPESSMVAIDTFEGGLEHTKFATRPYNLSEIESRFWSNVGRSENASRLTVMKAKSDEALIDLRKQQARFDFIYVDGSHVAFDVLHDAVLCWRMLNIGGQIVFDDLDWQKYMQDFYNPRIAIDAFLKCVALESRSQERNGQIWVQKVVNETPPTLNPAYKSITVVEDREH